MCLSECHTNLGMALRDLGDMQVRCPTPLANRHTRQGARTAFMNVIKLGPTADDHNNLACVCKDLGIITEAIENYQQALRLAPQNLTVFCNLVHSYQMVCDWTDYELRMQQLVAIVEYQLARGELPSVHPHHCFLYPLTNPTRRAIAAVRALPITLTLSATPHRPMPGWPSSRSRRSVRCRTTFHTCFRWLPASASASGTCPPTTRWAEPRSMHATSPHACRTIPRRISCRACRDSTTAPMSRCFCTRWPPTTAVRTEPSLQPRPSTLWTCRVRDAAVLSRRT